MMICSMKIKSMKKFFLKYDCDHLKRLLLTLLVALLSPFEVYGYEGPLFDAMAQLDEKPGFEKAISRVRDAGIYKIALFARSREYLGENEKALLNLHTVSYTHLTLPTKRIV